MFTALDHPMRALFALLVAFTLALVPGLADARPGQGQSIGSRGSHTWSAPPSTQSAPGGAYGFSQSATPNYGTGSGYNRGYGGYGSYGYGRSSFTSGLIGGFLGAGIGGLLFGRGFFGFHGGMGFLGLLLQLFLLYLLVRWLMRRFGAAPAMAGPVGFARGLFPGGMARPGGFGLGGAAPRQTIPLAPADYQQFNRLLNAIQGAWSAHDVNALRAMATPEMVGYFSEQMSEQASRGVVNRVSDVRLHQGDLSEAWAERGREYATVSMRFSMIDVTTDAAGRVVDGSPTERVTVTEFWTFLRTPGGQWVLSAIQQAR
jgi:predicted lipid-binding transport protein (Tim44 family)